MTLAEQCARVRCGPIAKAVLMCMVPDADGAGLVRVSMPTLAGYACITVRSIMRGMRELERAGHITRFRSMGSGVITEIHPRIGHDR